MKYSVVLSVQGKQTYPDQEPELIELVTEGYLEQVNNAWILSYEESDLTGLQGVTTTFHVEDKTITLTRSGKLNSQMVFREGESHDSLYQMEFGALMITVCAIKVDAIISNTGGSIDLVYTIGIEQSIAGTIEYYLDIQIK